MGNIHGNTLLEWGVQFSAVLFFVGGVVVLAVGVGLLARTDSTLRFFEVMNRWISTRRAFRAIEVPHDTRDAVLNHRRLLAVFCVCGAAFALYAFGVVLDARAAQLLFGLNTHGSTAATWLIESVRWILIVGNLAALVIGILLGFYPSALVALEARGGRWYSDRQLIKGADRMNLTLDHWVMASPRAAGFLITIAGVTLVSDFGILLFGTR